MEAAAQILERNGLDALNTNDVADRAGVSIGTLYQYFPDKHAILIAAAKRDLGANVTPIPSRQRAWIQALIRFVEEFGEFGAGAGSLAARVSGSTQVGASKRHQRPTWECERVDLVQRLLLDLFVPSELRCPKRS